MYYVQEDFAGVPAMQVSNGMPGSGQGVEGLINDFN